MSSHRRSPQPSPDELPDYVSSTRVKQAKARGYSTIFNPRNTEVDYYLVHRESLLDCVRDVNDVFFQAQPNIGVSGTLRMMSLLPTDDEPDPQPPVDATTDDVSCEDDDDPDEMTDILRAARIIQRQEPSQLDEGSSSSRRNPAREHKVNSLYGELKTLVPIPTPADKYSLDNLTRDEQIALADAKQQRDEAAEDPIDNEDDMFLGDISAVTVEDQKDDEVDRFPDVGLAHLVTSERPEPDPNDDPKDHESWIRRAGHKVLHECYLSLGENKPGARNTGSGEDEDERDFFIRRHLLQAEQDLYYYLSVYFHRDNVAKSVIAISAAGIFWRWREFTRDEIPPYDPLFDRCMPKNEEQMDQGFLGKFELVPFVEICTPESDAEMTKLRNRLKAMAENHPHYSCTYNSRQHQEELIKEKEEKKRKRKDDKEKEKAAKRKK
ncbi:hypothetical protein FISHEDRAFT_76268 [Fistulina hepatica ATCC 64428]|uniref:Uncharacterized protein n=1 Tax=Fistulina hepatica ATCC 64428 TaxID=1128425 RepID=A0A0D7A4P8_9AGAR|nr:hypothetical protein FISHEDRAFT_76268 [Fistulina hepatica ATCC 64428]